MSGVSRLQMVIDAAMRAHYSEVEKQVLMAILYGHSSRDLNVVDVRAKGSSVMTAIIQGKGGVVIRRINTNIPFEWT